MADVTSFPDQSRSIERVYRELRARGELDHKAFEAAVAMMRERQPDCPRETAIRTVSEVVFQIICRDPAWFWRDPPAIAARMAGGLPAAHAA
ncbi:MAG TPA: hypothetical protein VED40_12010 [Azospirillaceae bacterium]|nr:hypothetical protein [Azospirillaceae bacterium]